MSELLRRLAAGDTLVSDGAMGTLLMNAGLERGGCPDALSVSNPDVLSGIAATYALAGADIVHTNTFGASALKLAEYGIEDQTEAINEAAVRAARAGAAAGSATSGELGVDRDVLISASMGPCGRILEPYGDTPEDAVFESFHRQASALVRTGVDAVTVETMTDLTEACLAIRAVRQVDADVPILATMTFQETPRGFRTIMGVTVEDAVSGLVAAGANVVGSNCGNGIGLMVEIAQAFRGVTEHPVMIQANAGVPELRGGVVHYPETPEDFAAAVPRLVAAGASIIGGCCGTDPAHIRAIRHTIS